MALQLRRGTAQERLLSGVVPADGELLYTTDEKNLYVGDGVTPGGKLLTNKIGGWPIIGSDGILRLIETIGRTGGVVTATTAFDHEYAIGDEIVVSGAGVASLNGTFIITDIVSADTFKYNAAGLDVSTGATTAVVYNTQSIFPDNGVIVWNDTAQAFDVRTFTKADIGLGNVDNTADINKPVSTATQDALDTLQDQIDAIGTGGGGGGGGSGSASFPIGRDVNSALVKDDTGEILWGKSAYTTASKGRVHKYQTRTWSPVYLEENLTWETYVGLGNNVDANWTATAGQWGFGLDPRNYSTNNFYTNVQPTTSRNLSNNVSLLTWSAVGNNAAFYDDTYGRVQWHPSQGFKSTSFNWKSASPNASGTRYQMYTGSDFNIYGTGFPYPPAVDTLTIQEQPFVRTYNGSYNKWVGKLTDYADATEATSDGWTVQEFGEGYTQYIPNSAPTGTGGIAIPWTHTFNGSTITHLVFTGTGSILMLVSGQTAPVYNQGSSYVAVDKKTWWTANQPLIMCGEQCEYYTASKFMYRQFGTTGNRSIVLRFTRELSVDTYSIVEVFIHEGDSEIQIIYSPLILPSGYTSIEQMREQDWLDYSWWIDEDRRRYMGFGIARNSAYVGTGTSLANAYADNTRMRASVYDFQPGKGLITSYRNQLEKDVTGSIDGFLSGSTAGGLVIAEGGGIYSARKPKLTEGNFVDVTKTATSINYPTRNSFPSSPGQASYDISTGNYAALLFNRYNATSTLDFGTNTAGALFDLGFFGAGWASVYFEMVINGITYKEVCYQQPTFSSNYFYFTFKTSGAFYTLVNTTGWSTMNSNFATYAPTVIALTSPTSGSILYYTGSSWVSTQMTGISGGTFGSG